MDFKEYIESGKLELYVLGSCTTEELQEAECMARVFPEVRAELERIRSSVEEYVLANGVSPPVHLKSRIIAALEDDYNTGSVTETKVLSIVPHVQTKGLTLKYFIAASIILFFLCSAIIYNLYNKNDRLSVHISSLESLQKAEAEKFVLLQNQLDNSHWELLVMSNPRSFPVRLTGLPISPHSLTTIYWNRDSKEVFLSINILPQPPSGKQYQLWGIVNGAPVDLGIFEIPNEQNVQLLKMKSVNNAVAFAITLEKSGGSPVPTMNEMYVLGNI